MGRGQVVRQRFLVPKIVGSIPTAPATRDSNVSQISSHASKHGTRPVCSAIYDFEFLICKKFGYLHYISTYIPPVKF